MPGLPANTHCAGIAHWSGMRLTQEFMQTPLMQTLRWLRVPGDTVYSPGAVALVVFVASLKTGYSFRKSAESS